MSRREFGSKVAEELRFGRPGGGSKGNKSIHVNNYANYSEYLEEGQF